MKKGSIAIIALSIITLLTSCSAITGIFKAGVWAGVLFVVIIIAIIVFVLSKVFGGRNNQ